MSSKKYFDRRRLFGKAAAALAAQAGAGYLLSMSASRVQNATTRRLINGLTSGDGVALAEGCTFAAAKYLVWEIHVSAKFDEMGIIARPDAVGVGIAGNPNCDTSAVFPALGLTKQFGDQLAPVQNDIGMALVRCTTSNGNHVYDGYRLTNAKTGALVSWYNNQAQSLLRFDFGTNATADMATGVFGPGGKQEIVYQNMSEAVAAVLGALDPLASLNASAASLLQAMNDHVSKDPKFRAQLECLADQLKQAKAPLQNAVAVAGTAPMVTGNQRVGEMFDDATLLTINPLYPQYLAGLALAKLGLLSSVAMCIGNVDTNAGGDHNNRGGNNVAYGQRSPNEVKMCVGQIIAKIMKEVPNSLIVVASDGGRGANGGDAQNYTNFVVGPASLINTAFIGGDVVTSSTMFGNAPAAVATEGGSMVVPTQANVMATVAKAAGMDMSEAGAAIAGIVKA